MCVTIFNKNVFSDPFIYVFCFLVIMTTQPPPSLVRRDKISNYKQNRQLETMHPFLSLCCRKPNILEHAMRIAQLKVRQLVTLLTNSDLNISTNQHWPFVRVQSLLSTTNRGACNVFIAQGIDCCKLICNQQQAN